MELVVNEKSIIKLHDGLGIEATGMEAQYDIEVGFPAKELFLLFLDNDRIRCAVCL